MFRIAVRSEWTTRILIVLCAAIFCAAATAAVRGDGPESGVQAATGMAAPAHQSGPVQAQEPAAPKKAYELLALLEQRRGEPLPGYVGGREFHNRERRLPRGRYREYDVNPRIRGKPRDGERIVIEQQTGRAYYTNDHYRTFMPLK